MVSVALQRGRERGPRSVMVQPGDSTETTVTLDRGWGWGPVRRGFGGEAQVFQGNTVFLRTDNWLRPAANIQAVRCNAHLC